jgi:holo-[acyl-carrier protein] synthase
MVVGLGVDAFDVDRVEGELRTQDPAFLQQIFTPEEIADCQSQRRPAAHYAAHFAAKEAVLKALAPPVEAEVPLIWRDIDVRRRHDGHHDVILHGMVRALAKRRGVTRVLLSITLADDVALASVVLEAQA